MPLIPRGRDGNDIPTCRECGSIPVKCDGRWTCSNCGYVAGTALGELRDLQVPPYRIQLALAEARDEGYEAGRRDALEEAAKVAETVGDAHYEERKRTGTGPNSGVTGFIAANKIRALAGKL